MAITYNNIQRANFNGLQFILNGDGTSNVLVLNLSKPPFNINFNGVLPSSVVIETNDIDLTAVGTIALTPLGEDILTITFSAPPPISNTGPSTLFIYNSL